MQNALFKVIINNVASLGFDKGLRLCKESIVEVSDVGGRQMNQDHRPEEFLGMIIIIILFVGLLLIMCMGLNDQWVEIRRSRGGPRWIWIRGHFV